MKGEIPTLPEVKGPRSQKRKLSSEREQSIPVKKQKRSENLNNPNKKLVPNSQEQLITVDNQPSQSVTDSIFVFANLPLVYPILIKNNSISITTRHIKKLGVANIATQIARNCNQFAGRLSLFLENWKKMCTDRWILEAIQGYQIEWSEQRHQHQTPTPHHFPDREMESLDQEIQLVINKGAISPVVNHQGGFQSTIFLVPKRVGGTDL